MYRRKEDEGQNRFRRNLSKERKNRRRIARAFRIACYRFLYLYFSQAANMERTNNDRFYEIAALCGLTNRNSRLIRGFPWVSMYLEM